MKALMGKLAKKIMADPQGNIEMSKFITQSADKPYTIKLSDGSEYEISNKKPQSTPAT